MLFAFALFIIGMVLSAYSMDKDKDCPEILPKDILQALTDHISTTIKRAMTPEYVPVTSVALHTHSFIG
jgi:hypothetical protein